MTDRPSILVIDDKTDNFDVIQVLLAPEGYRLHYASSGHSALARMDRLQPDLILLDLMMPVLDGIEHRHHQSFGSLAIITNYDNFGHYRQERDRTLSIRRRK